MLRGQSLYWPSTANANWANEGAPDFWLNLHMHTMSAIVATSTSSYVGPLQDLNGFAQAHVASSLPTWGQRCVFAGNVFRSDQVNPPLIIVMPTGNVK